jgi:tRNA threonylcarbamoyl adenosine modification protein (Sua5/YciO/YrdC/YwlC family)
MIHLQVHPVNPQPRLLAQAVEVLKNRDGICVYPTDTVYGMGACATNVKAVNRIADLLERDRKRLFSFICSDFSQVSQYARVSNQHFRVLKRYLPGPFTFVLPVSNFVPKRVCPKRKTVGIRIPACPVVLELVKTLGEPLANTSIKLPGQSRGDPEAVKPAVLSEVDIMLDCGLLGTSVGSTIVDLTGDEPVVVREGQGVWEG